MSNPQGAPLHSVPEAAPPTGLSERDQKILTFERQWWKYAGTKEDAVRALFDLPPARYYQIVNDLIDRPEALEADPMLVKRLRRVRSGRQKARAARKQGMHG